MPTPLPTLDDLSLEEKIGQMLCLGWGGGDSYLAVNAQARRCMTELHAGGMIVMGRNVSPAHVKPLPPIDAAGVRTMLDELQSLARVPLLIPTDQEGGRVARFGTEPFTRMPSALAIGRTGDATLAREAARITAQELAAVGVNWDFAPVADVNSNPDNPVIGDRSFGNEPGVVARAVAQQVRGYQSGGVLACAKHFPGHGDTALDSHFALPTLPFTKEQMQARELVPFREAIASDTASIMTAHILFPALDAEYPATMSRAILTGLLREELGFDGLVVTDCLQMKAVADKWGTPHAALKAAQAGADILLICHTWEQQQGAYTILLDAARSGELPLERIDEAVGRVLAAKARLASRVRPGMDAIGTLEGKQVRDRINAPVEMQATTLGAEAPV